MLADYFTKPLQGRLLNMFRQIIMGWKYINTLHQISVLLKERVGECIKKYIGGCTKNWNGQATIRLRRRVKLKKT